MSTIQEKLSKLGELMARVRIEQKLRLRVVELTDGEGGKRYQLQLLDKELRVTAVQPAAEWAYRMQSVHFDLANELSDAVRDLAGSFANERSRAMAAEAALVQERAVREVDVATTREDAFDDGQNSVMVRIRDTRARLVAEKERVLSEGMGYRNPRNRDEGARLQALIDFTDSFAVESATATPPGSPAAEE